MTLYQGDFPINSLVDFKWNTSGSTGASITRGTDGTLRIYKNNAVAERTSLNGVTQTEDFDALTGVHHVRIDLSDNTDAGFYAAGSEISVVMAGMVIDTQTVNAEIASFSIERTGGAIALLKSRLVGTIATGTHNPQSGDAFARLGAPIGASISADVAGVQSDTNDLQTRVPAALVSGRIDASVGAMAANTVTSTAIAAAALNGKGDWNIGKTGYALSAAGNQAIWDVLDSVITLANSIGLRLKTFVDVAISSRSTYTGADTAGTTTLLSRIIGTLATGTHQPQGGDSFARLGAPSGASISADIQTRATQTSVDAIGTAVDTEVAAIKAKTDQLVFTNANKVDAAIVSAADFAQAAADKAWSTTTRLLTAGTNIVLVKGTGVTGFNDLSTTQVNTEVTTALAAVNLDHLVGTAAGIPAIPSGTYLDQIMDDGTAVYDRTTDSLQAIRDVTTSPSDAGLLLLTTVNAVATPTEVTLTAGSNINGSYEDQGIAFYDVSNNNHPSIRRVLTYVGVSRTVTLDRAPDFVVVSGDVVRIFVAPAVDTEALVDNLVGPRATVVSNGSNTALSFQVDIPTVTEIAPNWWKDAWWSWDLTATLAGQTKRISSFNQSTGFVTVVDGFTTIPTAGDTAHLVTR